MNSPTGEQREAARHPDPPQRTVMHQRWEHLLFLHWTVEPDTRAFQPAPGLMVLFPSYMFHETIPFESSETRISIAFDIVPEA